jgi:hypothetical protein
MLGPAWLRGRGAVGSCLIIKEVTILLVTSYASYAARPGRQQDTARQAGASQATPPGDVAKLALAGSAKWLP